MTQTSYTDIEIRCPGRKSNGQPCNRLLAKGAVEVGEVELFCPYCKNRFLLRATRPNHAPHDGLQTGDCHVLEESRP